MTHSRPRDNNGTLDLHELIAMCRKLSNLSYSEAGFVQVRNRDGFSSSRGGRLEEPGTRSSS